jgi:hypothetical protein
MLNTLSAMIFGIKQYSLVLRYIRTKETSSIYIVQSTSFILVFNLLPPWFLPTCALPTPYLRYT